MKLLVTVVVFSVLFVAIYALNDESGSIAVEQEPMEKFEVVHRKPNSFWKVVFCGNKLKREIDVEFERLRIKDQQNQLETLNLQIMEKRIPHPSWRSNVRVSQFQQGVMPPLAQYLPLTSGRQRYFGRYARVPFSINFPNF
ncbi:hypothetical protein M3Y95_01259100 [Aphelenchoides besseyi]|nr:hypothetical protein M3Y95_01259100 [Aphelenchoides besseyi]